MKRNIRQIKPEDLPNGIIVNLSEDYRGHCYLIDHIEYGCLGRLVIINIAENTQKLQYDFFEGDESRDNTNYQIRIEMFKEVIRIINQTFEGDLPLDE